MAKIPFGIKYRPQIESGEYKVETRDGRPARIVCWDRIGTKPFNNCNIVTLVTEPRPKSESAYYYYQDGHLWNKANGEEDSVLDLILITPEPEVSEFEEAVGAEIFDPPFNGEQIKVIKEESAKLLELARKEINRDLPIWKKCAPCDEDKSPIPAWIVRFDAELAGESAVVHNGHYILFGELDKLPKEDKK